MEQSKISCGELAAAAVTVDEANLPIAGFVSRPLQHDGVPLRVFEGGAADAPAVLVCMPHGTPVGVYHKLFEALLERFHVVTWESRGYPVINDNFDDIEVGLEAHVGDAAFVVEQCGLSEFSAIGLCSGAAVLSWLSGARGLRIDRAVMINANLNLSEIHPNTEFKTGMLSLLETLSNSRSRAKGYAAAFKSGSFSDGATDLFEDAFNADVVRDLQHRAFRDGETAFRYAKMDVAVCSSSSLHILPDVAAKTLLIGFLDNNVIPWQWSIEAMRRMPRATVQLYAKGGHFAVCKHLEVIERAIAFLGRDGGA